MTKLFIKHKLIYIFLFFITLGLVAQAQNDGNRYTNNSVLATGDWIKIKTPTTGVYKITYDELLQMGISNPKNVQVYGYGGWMLDEDFLTEYIDDLPQVSIWMSNSPENFGSGDYILFYARGNIKWTYNKTTQEFVHTQNPYSFESFYFITESSTDSKTILKKNATPVANGVVINTFDDYYLHEKDSINISETGREFFGESFNTNRKQTYPLNLEGIVSNSASLIRYEFISHAPSSGGSPRARLVVSPKTGASHTTTIPYPDSDFLVARSVTDSYTVNSLTEDDSLILEYIPSSEKDKNTYLNYFRINYSRDLKPYGAVTPFRSKNLFSSGDFSISNTHQNVVVLDVTTPSTPTEIIGSQNGDKFSFSASNSDIKEYVIIDLEKAIPSPEFVGKISNQNLHSLPQTDMIIIVQPILREYAQELALAHYEDSGLKSHIVTPNDIYNEFSSGNPDATAYRRFIKMFYDRAKSDAEKPKYLLLFGSGSFDNRLINPIWETKEKDALLLTFQSVNSTKETDSYVTDDYFGFLDDNEGRSLKNDKLDIGIGRLTVKNKQEAANVVAKIKRYMKNEDAGIWQNNIMLIADDAIGSSSSSPTSERVHMVDTDNYAKFLKENYPEFTITKMYEDIYKYVNTNRGNRYPDVTKAILKKINEGTLLVNYVGHGSASDWTHEYVMTSADITALNNSKLPLWITATCGFSRFDSFIVSAGEQALLNPNGGAIALFSTVRVVFSSNNEAINAALFRNIFAKDNERPLRLGDIMKNSKTLTSNLLTDDNKLRFQLLGDPALRLNYPGSTYKVEITSINGLPASTKTELKAMSSVSIKGRITNTANNTTASNFSGTLESIIYDNEQNLKTRGNLNSDAVDSQIAIDYKDFTNTIFTGKTEINNGEFEINFTVPENIMYGGNDGKMNFFAANSDNTGFAQGTFDNYRVVNSNNSSGQITTPPVISRIYLDSETFKSGDIVSNPSTLFAEISDEHGINLSGAAGYEISLNIDGISYNVTPSFTSTSSSGKTGNLEYKLPVLSEGKHLLTLKTWGVSGNSASKSLNFETISNENSLDYKLSIDSKSSDFTRFYFSCNPSSHKVHLKYEVFMQDGTLVWSQEFSNSALLLNNTQYDWNFIGNNGQRAKSGVYICKATVDINGNKSSKTEELTILKQ